ncbi:MAG: hypothetical protein ACOC47_00850 [Alkalispirochaetaceae bacterium]
MFSHGRNEEEETRRFWESVEREAGMPVLEYALGQYISGYDDREGPVWGLLYLTAETLYFRHFPSSNWFSAILGSGRSEQTGDEAFIIKVPVGAITQVERQTETSLWERIFRPRPSVTVVHYLAGSTSREIRISLEHRGEDFREQLRSLVE